MSHHTSAKGKADKLRAYRPRRVHLICPICEGKFTLNYAEYRRCIRVGTRPCDSRKCGRAFYRLKKAAGIIPAAAQTPQEASA
jgi:hypothetical protein